MKKHRTRAQNGDGSCYQREGRPGWTCSISERDENGHLCRRSFSAPTATAAKAKRDDYLRRQGVTPPQDSKATASDALTLEGWSERFLDDTRKQCEPKTFANYKLALGHLLPLIGKLSLRDLKRQDVDAALEGIRKSVSASMASRSRRALHTCLEQAIAKELISDNAAKSLKERQGRAARAARGLTSKIVYTPTTEECDRIFAAARGNRLEALLIVAVTCGLRWAELAGLRGPTLTSPSARSPSRKRCASLLSATTGKSRTRARSAPFLTARRTSQAGSLTFPKSPSMRCASANVSPRREARSRRSPYCFTASNGSPLRASNFNRRTWRDIRDAAGLPDVTMHGLRHACSSIMASRGASAKQIAARLGHADVRLTMNRYTQLDRTSQVAGAAIFDQEFGRAS